MTNCLPRCLPLSIFIPIPVSAAIVVVIHTHRSTHAHMQAGRQSHVCAVISLHIHNFCLSLFFMLLAFHFPFFICANCVSQATPPKSSALPSSSHTFCQKKASSFRGNLSQVWRNMKKNLRNLVTEIIRKIHEKYF